MDSQRQAVLQLLQQNARLTTAQIAERLALPVAEVEAIIAQAEADHSIRGYYALIREDAFDQEQVRALIEVCVEPERDAGFDRIARDLARFPEVRDVLLVSGTYDLLLTVVGSNLREVADFVASKLAPTKGVRSTRTSFLLRRYKESGFTFEDDEEHERLQVSP